MSEESADMYLIPKLENEIISLKNDRYLIRKELKAFDKKNLSLQAELKKYKQICERLEVNQQKKPSQITLHNEWCGMQCEGCDRYNKDGICDFNGEQPDYKFCRIFVPKGLPPKFRQMWLDYQQRFVIERQE